MIDIRLRSRIGQPELKSKVGKIVTDGDYNLLLTGAARVYKPSGELLAVYLPAALHREMAAAYEHLHKVQVKTFNRGAASGSPRVAEGTFNHTKSKAITSSLLGSFDPYGRDRFCRLTAFTAQHPEAWGAMLPLWVRIGELFAEHVPERYAAQVRATRATHPDWVIAGTPFTTITINNTYPTGVHTDKGDLDAGFSCLAVHRRGDYVGGVFTFPEFRLGIDLRDGDLILMDAHEYHGNTMLYCPHCAQRLDRVGHSCTKATSPERISVVAYYRTRMTTCGSMVEENEKRGLAIEERNQRKVGAP
jgi:hypothetical protein